LDESLKFEVFYNSQKVQPKINLLVTIFSKV